MDLSRAFPRLVSKEKNQSVRPSFLHRWTENAREKGHYFCHNESPHLSIPLQHQTIAVSIRCLSWLSSFAREAPEKHYGVLYLMAPTQLSCPISTYDNPTESEPFFPNDSAADREAKLLGLDKSPSRWQGGNDGWILWKRYTPIPTKWWLPRENIKEVLQNNIPVTIRTLPFDDQCTAYHQLHKTATPAQLAAYYTLHIAQLELARCWVAYGKHKLLKEPKQISPTCLFHRHDQTSSIARLARASTTLQAHYQVRRALFTNAEYRLRNQYVWRAQNRARVRGWERLVEECENLLLRKQASFTTIDWRPFKSRKRWQDGVRGWTGLSEEEVRGDDVEVAGGRDGSADMVSCADSKKVWRVKFAREFPRGMDRREDL